MRSDDVDAVVEVFRFGKIHVRDVHVSDAERDRVARVDVVTESAAEVHGKDEILPLRKTDAVWSAGIDVSDADVSVKVWSCVPATGHEVATHSHAIPEKTSLWSSWYRGGVDAEGGVPVAAEYAWASYVSQMPAQEYIYGCQCVRERILCVIAALEEVEWERNILREPATLDGYFESIQVVVLLIEIWSVGLGFALNQSDLVGVAAICKGRFWSCAVGYAERRIFGWRLRF